MSYFLAFWVVALTPLDVANTLEGGGDAAEGTSVLTVLVRVSRGASRRE